MFPFSFASLSTFSKYTITDAKRIEYTISEISYSDSKYNDRKLSLIITPTSTLSVNDASIKYNGETYYLNRNKEFIIPLNDVQISGTNKIKFIFNRFSIIDIYNMFFYTITFN